MSTILVIDDDRLMTEVIETFFRGKGFDVLVAHDGLSGVEVFQRHPVDIVLSDIVMPGQEGIETIRKIREVSVDVPVIAMSGADSADLFLSVAGEYGANEIVHKPFIVEKLWQIVKGQLA